MNTRKLGVRADKARSYFEIEKIAFRVRQELLPTLPITDAVPGVLLFDDYLLNYPISTQFGPIPVDCSIDKTIVGGEAQSSYCRERHTFLITLSEESYDDLENGGARARFTLAHELGHVVLHPHELLRLSSVPHSIAAYYRGEHQPHKIFYDTEWQADSFAGAFLMPASGIHDLVGERLLSDNIFRTLSASMRVADNFDVSESAARTRLSKVKTRWRELSMVR